MKKNLLRSCKYKNNENTKNLPSGNYVNSSIWSEGYKDETL